MRIINTVLVVLLAAFASFVAWGALQVPSAQAQAADVQAAWTPGGQGLRLAVAVRNGEQWDLHALSLTVRPALDGDAFPEATVPVDGTVPRHGLATVAGVAPLPAGFVQAWWTKAAHAGEATQFRLDGTLQLSGPAGVHVVPFAWVAGWQGRFAPGLARGAPCDKGLCLRTEAAWDLGDLQLTVHVRNAGATPVHLDEANATLRLANRSFAAGESGRDVTLAPGAEGGFVFPLRRAAGALEAWWPRHTAACEASPAALELGVSFDRAVNATAAATSARLAVHVSAGPLETHFVCRAGA